METRKITKHGIVEDDVVATFSNDGLTATLAVSFDSDNVALTSITYDSVTERDARINRDVQYFVEKHKRTVFQIDDPSANVNAMENDSMKSIMEDAKKELFGFFNKFSKNRKPGK